MQETVEGIDINLSSPIDVWNTGMRALQLTEEATYSMISDALEGKKIV